MPPDRLYGYLRSDFLRNDLGGYLAPRGPELVLYGAQLSFLPARLVVHGVSQQHISRCVRIWKGQGYALGRSALELMQMPRSEAYQLNMTAAVRLNASPTR